MSVKHVKRYYKQISEQYSQMVYLLHEMEKEANVGLIDPERVENMQKSVAILKDNYQRWAYMMYLLCMPNKKEKASSYKNRVEIEAYIPHRDTADGVLEENKKALNSLRDE